MKVLKPNRAFRLEYKELVEPKDHGAVHSMVD